MVDLVDVFNDITTEVLIRRTINRVISTLYENFQVKYMQSSLVFRGYLVELVLKDNKFHAYLIDRYHIWTLHYEITSYGLANFIAGTRWWLIKALTEEQSLSNPCFFAKHFNIRKYENFISKHGLTISQIKVIENHDEIVSYL